MISKEILKKVRKIEIQTKNLVNNVFAGEYHSIFKGRGMEFSEVREYQLGDDIRTIDWNVTARMGHPYIKKFVEERELTIMLLFDASSSFEFGTTKQTKGEIAIEICALLAFSAIKNNDRVGLIIFTDQIEKFIPPKKGRKHILRIIRELLCFKPMHNKTNISYALEYLDRIIRKKSVAFLISDFLSPDFTKDLRVANKRHDIIAITITDPREIEFPKIGFLNLQDAETGEEILLDTADDKVRNLFSNISFSKQKERTKIFKSSQVDNINILTNKPYDEVLMNFFKERAKRFR